MQTRKVENSDHLKGIKKIRLKSDSCVDSVVQNVCNIQLCNKQLVHT